MTILWIALCLAFATLLTAPSHAQTSTDTQHPAMPENPPNPDAETHFHQGVAFAKLGQYADAVRAFSESFSAGGNRAALFAWAQSERLAGHCGQAIPLYQRFVAVSVHPEEKQAAEIGLRRCEQVALTPPASPPAKIAMPVSQPPQANGWALGVASTGVALTAAAAILAVVSETERRAADRATTYENHREARERTTTLRWAGAISGGFGVTALAVGLWLYSRPQEPSQGTGLSFAPLSREGGMLMSWRGAF